MACILTSDDRSSQCKAAKQPRILNSQLSAASKGMLFDYFWVMETLVNRDSRARSVVMFGAILQEKSVRINGGAIERRNGPIIC